MTYPKFIIKVAESAKPAGVSSMITGSSPAGFTVKRCIRINYMELMGFIRVDTHKRYGALRPGDVLIYPENEFNLKHTSQFHINKWCLDMSNTLSNEGQFVNTGPGLHSMVFRHAWAGDAIHELELLQSEINHNFMRWYNNKWEGTRLKPKREKSWGNVNFSEPLPLP